MLKRCLCLAHPRKYLELVKNFAKRFAHNNKRSFNERNTTLKCGCVCACELLALLKNEEELVRGEQIDSSRDSGTRALLVYVPRAEISEISSKIQFLLTSFILCGN